MKKSQFDKIKKSIRQMKDIEKGRSEPSRVFSYPDIGEFRKRLHVSRA